jgi:hypothetical protein
MHTPVEANRDPSTQPRTGPPKIKKCMSALLLYRGYSFIMLTVLDHELAAERQRTQLAALIKQQDNIAVPLFQR